MISVQNVVKSSLGKCCKRVNVKVFQSDKCEKVLSSHRFGSVAKESMSKCFKVTSVKKSCKRVNVKVFQK